MEHHPHEVGQITINRPLSPHLQIYSLPLTAWLSISHRITGVILSVGFALLSLILIILLYGPDAYDTAQRWMTSWAGFFFLWLWLAAFALHLVHGLRHMLLDAGLSFEPSKRDYYARVEIFASFGVYACFIVFNLVKTAIPCPF